MLAPGHQQISPHATVAKANICKKTTHHPWPQTDRKKNNETIIPPKITNRTIDNLSQIKCLSGALERHADSKLRLQAGVSHRDSVFALADKTSPCSMCEISSRINPLGGDKCAETSEQADGINGAILSISSATFGAIFSSWSVLLHEAI